MPPNNMPPNNNDEVFNGAIYCLKEGVKLLARDKNGASHGRKAKRCFGSEVLGDPAVAHTKALEYFFDEIAIPSTNLPATSTVRSLYFAQLMDWGSADILFGCLPDPEAFERSHKDMEEMVGMQEGFYEFLKYLVNALEDNVLDSLCCDQLVAGLFIIGLRPISHTHGGPEYNVRLSTWQNDLRMLAWSTSRDSPYGQHAVRLLDYLRWEVRGRKDLTCPVQKPWTSSNLKELNRGAPRDLRSIVPGNWLDSLAASCRELRHLVRRARLFQVTFNLYLMLTDGDSEFSVRRRGEVIKKYMRKQIQSDPTAGRDPLHEDLRSPDYTSGLYHLCCCTIKESARELLEYFIHPSCTSIVFHNFCPKNAETTVIQMKNPKIPHEIFKEGISNMSMAHTVARLTTASGHQLAFDPTAAQFGWLEKLAPWERYKRRRIDVEYSSAVFEPLGKLTHLTKHTRMPSDPTLGKDWKDTCVAEEMVCIADRILARDSLIDILDVPEDDFESCLWVFKTHLEIFIGNSAFLAFLRDL